MAPKKTRDQFPRQTNVIVHQPLDPEVIAKRTRRHLDELERTNYAEHTLLQLDNNDEGSGKYGRGRARQTISDKRNLNIPGNSPAAKKKKSTMNVRTALLYHKNLATLIEESNIATLPSSVQTYLTAAVPPSPYPPRMLCSVCGYFGSYRCRRCSLPYCDRNCEAAHIDTRCERRVV